MSRTYRRNNKDSIRGFLGTVENVDSWDRRRFPGKTDEEVYQRRVAWYRGDNHSNRWNAASWWRRIHYNVPSRRRMQHELHRCIRANEWDDHLTLEPRGARSWWWWIHM